jgi:excisionase family DNA binding protein
MNSHTAPCGIYLTVADVADTLGVSTRTVLRWIERGDLPAVRLPGGRLRVSQTALAASLAGWALGGIAPTTL